MTKEYCGCDENTRLTKDCPEHYHLADQMKIYRTTCTIVRYFRAESPDEAKAALTTFIRDEIDDDHLIGPPDYPIVIDEVTEDEVKDLEVEDADDYLTGA